MQSKMDCNNNDGTNYVYQMQQTMNSTMNGMMNNVIGSNGNNMQPQQQQNIAYDKKSQFDLATSNNSVYLNGHSATPPINNLSNNMSTSSISANSVPPGNLPPNNMHQTGGPFNAQSPIASPRTSNTPNRLNHQYQDYSTFNGSGNYYGNFERNLHYNQTNLHLNQANHHPSISQVQSKESRPPVSMPYHEANSNTNPMYNHHHSTQSNHLSNNLPVHQQPQVHHSNQQIPSQHQNLRPHHIPQQQQQHMNSHNAYPQPTSYPVQQQHVVNTYNNSPAVNSNFSQPNANNAVAGVYNANYYNNGYNGDQWRYQLASGSPPQRIINQQQPPNSQVQMNSMPSGSINQGHVKMENSMTNLNNSANLSQPYSNMHISNNAMNNSMNSSMNSLPMTISPTINQQQQQLPPNSFNPNQANNTNYMPMNSYSPYQPPVDNHQVQQNHYLTSPSPQNHQTNIHQQQYHLNKNTGNHLQTLHPSNNHTPNALQSNLANNVQQTKSHLSALDETLDSVVNGTIELPLTVNSSKPTRRRRGKGKTTKEKGKKETKSAYALFFKQTQEELKRSNPKMNFGDISKTVANRWSLLSDEHKQGYKSITDKERKVKLEELAKEKAMKVSGVMETRSELDDNSLLTD